MQDAFKSTALAAAEGASDAPWLAARRTQSRDAFSALALPDRKVEGWKYNDLSKVYGEAVQLTSASDLAVARELAADTLALEAPTVTLVDGQYCAELSRLPSGLNATSFSEASAEQHASLAQSLGTQARADGQAFVLLNEALNQDGVLVEVGSGESPAESLHILNLRTAAGTAAPRVWVSVGENAQLTIAEHHLCAEGVASFDLPVSELHIGANSTVHHYRFALSQSGGRHIGRVATRQERDSRYYAYLAVLGGDFNRLDFGLDLQGQHCESELYGLYMCRGQEHTDIHLAVDHALPHCDSKEVFRGMAAEQGKAVFNGRIHIHQDAQKTNAELSNRNLLLSRTAEINTKPELEIYADDVKCAHGATVGQLDPEALFYLRSRGTPLEAAQSLLSYGFINEVLLAMPDQAIAGLVTPRVDAFFNDLEKG